MTDLALFTWISLLRFLPFIWCCLTIKRFDVVYKGFFLIAGGGGGIDFFIDYFLHVDICSLSVGKIYIWVHCKGKVSTQI